jgi:hypothetical protein
MLINIYKNRYGKKSSIRQPKAKKQTFQRLWNFQKQEIRDGKLFKAKSKT